MLCHIVLPEFSGIQHTIASPVSFSHAIIRNVNAQCIYECIQREEDEFWKFGSGWHSQGTLYYDVLPDWGVEVIRFGQHCCIVLKREAGDDGLRLSFVCVHVGV